MLIRFRNIQMDILTFEHIYVDVENDVYGVISSIWPISCFPSALLWDYDDLSCVEQRPTLP